MTTSEIKAKFLMMDGDDEASIANVAMECFNCRRAELLLDGSVLIADPQAEQILSDEKMQELFDFIADRNSGICAQCGRELEAGEVVTCDTCDRRYQSR